MDHKVIFMNILKSEDDPYDILESTATAQDFVENLSNEQKEDLVEKVFSFMDEHEVDMTAPITDSPSRLSASAKEHNMNEQQQ